LFQREHHQHIERILAALDATLLRKHQCWFGGGTAVALSCGEFRESRDVDFLVSDPEGYRSLRMLVRENESLLPLFRAGANIEQVRPARIDQYGIRALLQVDRLSVKFEIVREARISLDVPKPSSRIAGIRRLSLVDLTASKLLANSDRFRDDSVYCRDLIDLAMLAPERKTFTSAWAKAKLAYGDSVATDLSKAVQSLRERPKRLEECQRALGIDTTPKALLWQRIKAVEKLAERAAQSVSLT
jgi:hypothetical protein